MAYGKDITIRDSDGTDNSQTTSGTTYQKTGIVATIDIPARGVVAEGNSLSQVQPVFVGGRDASGNSRGATVKVLDSRDGLDTNISSVAAKELVFFHSDNPSHRLTAGSSKLFPTDIPGGSTWFDLDGYMGFQVDWVDNTGGADGATLQVIWSQDQTAYAEEFDTGNTQSLFVATTDNNIHKFIPKQGRYCKLKLVNGSVNQGSTVPNIAVLILTALPHTFTNTNYIANTTTIPVRAVDATNVSEALAYPFVIAGTNDLTSPTVINPLVIDSGGNAAVKGTATNYTNTPVITTQKLASTSTAANVGLAITSTQVLAAATARIGITIYNDSSQIVYIKKGTGCSTTSFDWILQPYDTLSIPSGIGYSGVIHHIAAVATGNLRVSSW